ncbi:MAG: alpha-galactosidase, partial [Firmicutes bacterium]|nr:alpha-galactosidase [Bacillota bacterium]
VNACDISFLGTNPVLKGLLGDQFSQYFPYERNLMMGNASFVTTTGRPCEEYMPYFNLETDSGGVMAAVGWPGDWEADFRYENKATRFLARQGNFETYLEPGEIFRTPLMAFVRYGVRDEQTATNAWRQWFIDCNMHKVDGEPMEPVTAAASCMYETNSMAHETEEFALIVAKAYAQNGIRVDYLWIDAGWYLSSDFSPIIEWKMTGTWEVDTNRFPTSFKALSDYAHSRGGKMLVWFEPESVRYFDMDDLESNFGFNKDWLIPNSMWGENCYLADLGDPDCRQWIFERIKAVLEKGNIDLYRQDGNTRPAESWEIKDAQGKRGLTENRYCLGYLSFWDALLAWKPDLRIDSCASGGNRNDLETARRSVPLHRSDRGFDDHDLKQSMHMELFKWLPYFGAFTSEHPIKAVDEYGIRSTYVGALSMGYRHDMQSAEWENLYKYTKEWRQVIGHIYDDYYPLTPYSRTRRDWRGWQFFSPEKQEGYFQMFRPENSIDDTYTMKLFGLYENATYIVEDFDGVNNFELTGKQLNEGFTVALAQARSALTATIRIKDKTISGPIAASGGIERGAQIRNDYFARRPANSPLTYGAAIWDEVDWFDVA